MCPAVLGSWKHGQIAMQEQQRRLGCFGDCFGISSLQSLTLFCLYSPGCVWAHPSWGKSYSIKAGFLPAMCVHPRLFFGSSKLPFQEKLKQYHCTAHAALFCKERAFHSLSKGNTDRYSSFTPISMNFQLRCWAAQSIIIQPFDDFHLSPEDYWWKNAEQTSQGEDSREYFLCMHWVGNVLFISPGKEVGKTGLEELKSKAEYDGTVQARAEGSISSAQVHWKTCQSHSGLQGSV